MASPGDPAGTPWEHRQEIGTWAAWRDTLVTALFEPAKLFGSARLGEGRKQAAFAVVTVSIFSLVGQFLNRFLLGPFRQRAIDRLRDQGLSSPLLEKLFAASTAHSTGTLILAMLLTPAIVFVVLYLNAAVTHAFAALLGQNKRGFPATFAACAYACAPLVLCALPGCGESIGLIWAVILTGIGLKHTHGIRSGGAAAAVIAPYVLLFCGGCALAVLVGVLGGRGALPQ